VRRRRAILIASAGAAALVIAAGVGVAFAVTGKGNDVAMPVPSASSSRSATPTPSPTPTPTPTPTLTPTPTPTGDGFDKSAHSIDDPNSIWVVVDKLRPLNPADYAPDVVQVPVPYVNEPYLRPVVSDAAVAMFAAFAAETGLQMQSQSAYRSYDTQVRVYQGWVDSLGQAGADNTSARPGFSEHQTGLAVDINALPDRGCALEPCWGDTPHAQWLLANSWKYGFIVRYQVGETPITGYESEPYHMRYVGVDLATEMHKTGVKTLEEFFGLPAAPDYAH